MANKFKEFKEFRLGQEKEAEYMTAMTAYMHSNKESRIATNLLNSARSSLKEALEHYDAFKKIAEKFSYDNFPQQMFQKEFKETLKTMFSGTLYRKVSPMLTAMRCSEALNHLTAQDKILDQLRTGLSAYEESKNNPKKLQSALKHLEKFQKDAVKMLSQENTAEEKRKAALASL